MKLSNHTNYRPSSSLVLVFVLTIGQQVSESANPTKSIIGSSSSGGYVGNNGHTQQAQATINRQQSLKEMLANKILGQSANQFKGRLFGLSSMLPQSTGGQSQLVAGKSQDVPEEEYRCAKFCSCSLIQVVDGLGRLVNLSRANCESNLFTDILSIDRRTQVIHISLPFGEGTKFSNTPPETMQQANKNQVAISALSTPSQPSVHYSSNVASRQPVKRRQQQEYFRMPRLIQFGQLREIVIVNLKLEVCETEVFKRGQRLRRLVLNHNRLSQISKACLRHLDRLIELNLDFNSLEELESALFNSLLNLRSLSLAHNRLSQLAAHQFANLTNLMSLNLVGNSFKTINLHLLEPMSNTLRFLSLARNQIKSFTHTPPQLVILAGISAPNVTSVQANKLMSLSPMATSSQAGVIFKNLIKLNVDRNHIERIKSLQLHRFYNVRHLSVRYNQIASIRDKAFNGLKLIELNLANNQLASISKCSFCNATIKRLILAHNNISLPMGQLLLTDTRVPAKVAPPSDSQPALDSAAGATGNRPNMLILSQSILGPLYSELDYLDLSYNEQMGAQLEAVLEPLLKLEYLNLAKVGFERSLPAPNMFRNLRKLRYLNLTHNELDQLVVDTIEPLVDLEVLDIAHNKFNELDESFLVALDELPSLKLVNMASNPWFCSQCKVAPLHDWILRSPIYNATCLLPLASQQLQATNSDVLTGDIDDQGEQTSDTPSSIELNHPDGSFLERWASILVDGAPGELAEVPTTNESPIKAEEIFDQLAPFDFELGQEQPTTDYSLSNTQSNAAGPNSLMNLLAEASGREDDPSVALTLARTMAASSVLLGERPLSQLLANEQQDLCLRCEFPGELRRMRLHELGPSDFKFCAGAAPRSIASEPKVGLTLAIVIILALLCLIVIVIVMYKRKGNAYYNNEPASDTSQLASNGRKSQLGQRRQQSTAAGAGSDLEQQYAADATDYSSPPMSQSEEDDEDEEYVDEDEEDEVNYLDQEEEEEEEEEEDIDNEEDEEVDNDDLAEDQERAGDVDMNSHPEVTHAGMHTHKPNEIRLQDARPTQPATLSASILETSGATGSVRDPASVSVTSTARSRKLADSPSLRSNSIQASRESSLGPMARPRPAARASKQPTLPSMSQTGNMAQVHSNEASVVRPRITESQPSRQVSQQSSQTSSQARALSWQRSKSGEQASTDLSSVSGLGMRSSRAGPLQQQTSRGTLNAGPSLDNSVAGDPAEGNDSSRTGHLATTGPTASVPAGILLRPSKNFTAKTVSSTVGSLDDRSASVSRKQQASVAQQPAIWTNEQPQTGGMASPELSDATSADSLALEALNEYLASTGQDLGHSSLPEPVEVSLEEQYEDEEEERAEDNNDDNVREIETNTTITTPRAPADNLERLAVSRRRGRRLTGESSLSVHSALTQTSSREGLD